MASFEIRSLCSMLVSDEEIMDQLKQATEIIDSGKAVDTLNGFIKVTNNG